MTLQGLSDATSVYAELVASFGPALEGADLVLPDNEHFPDVVDLSAEGIRTLFERVLGYTPVPSDAEFELQFLAPEGEASSCSSGACGPAADTPWKLHHAPGSSVLVVAVQEAGSPIRLMSQLSRLAGDLLLSCADVSPGAHAFERAVRAEIAAVTCGLGPMLLAASHFTQKGCGGLNTHEGTALSTPVLAGLTALFAEQHRVSLRGALGILQPTPSEALADARAFFAKRPQFVQQLRSTPEAVAFHCDFGAEEGLLRRFFGQPAELRVTAR